MYINKYSIFFFFGIKYKRVFRSLLLNEIILFTLIPHCFILLIMFGFRYQILI